jgi:hypothetical protein
MSVKIANQMSRNLVYAKAVSAGTDHIVHGVGAIAMFLIVEAMVVYEIMTAELGVWIAIAFIMQAFAIYFINYAIKYLAPLYRKADLALYFSKLEDVVDISGIQEHHNVLLIDSYGVVFTDTSNQIAIDDWMLVNKGTPTKTIEKRIVTK